MLRHLWVLLLCASVASAKPNVLWICADDHAAYAIGAYGSKLARTPNIDRFAATGVRFDRAYCNSPVCTASRQSFLTGRYPRTIGVTQLQTPLPEAEATLAEMFGPAGYGTAAIGKMHFNSASKHGFDVVENEGTHARWLAQQPKFEPPAGLATQPAWKPFKDPAAVWLNAAAAPMPLDDERMQGTYFARKAEGFLARKRERPFFCMVSFTEPHSPFRFPVEYAGRRRAEEFPAHPASKDDEAQVPAIFRDLTDAEKRGINAAYHTSVEFLDRNVGRVLKALEASGHADNTIVIYTGDHGYMLGQHGRFEKHCGYEPAVRAPLIIRWPTGRAGATAALVEFVDVAPTLLELAGVPAPANVQGRSLVPVLEGKAKGHREQVFIEYSENEEAYVVTERYKFIYSTGRRPREDGYETGLPLPGRTIRLFDLHEDPDELRDLSREPAHEGRAAELTRMLAEHLRRTAREPESIPKTDDVHVVLEHGLRPRDLRPAKKGE
jgi:arylsulfatase A-like enzyme